MHFDNISLIDIFKQEAESQGELFEKAILAFIKNPKDFSQIDIAMRAAHSMKGASQIVGLKKVSHIAHLLEDCLVSVQKEERILTIDELNSLLEVFDILVKIRFLETEKMLAWPGEQDPSIGYLESVIMGICKHNQDTMELQTKGVLVDLFCEELAMHLKVLESIADIQNIDNISLTDTITRAPHSIKGAAGILGFHQLVELGGVMEMWLNSVQEGIHKWTIEDKNLLVECIDILKPCTQITPSTAEKFLNQIRPKVTQLIDSIRSKIDPNKKKSDSLDSEKKIAIEFPADTAVKVSSDNLNKIMGLAAELLVQMRQFKTIKNYLLKNKTIDLQLNHALEGVLDEVQSYKEATRVREVLFDIKEKIQRRVQQAWEVLEDFDDLMGRTTIFSEGLYQGVLVNCMTSFDTCVRGLPRLVHDLGYRLGKKIHLEVIGRETPIDRYLVEKLESALNHIVRNACDHAIEQEDERRLLGKPIAGSIIVRAYHNAGLLMVEVTDDGRGIDLEILRKKVVDMGLLDKKTAQRYPRHKLLDFIFMPRFSTATSVSEVSGRGVGLDVVHDFVEQEGGAVRIHTEINKGTTFALQLPVMRSVIKILLVKVGVGAYAFPMVSIYRVVMVPAADIKKRKNVYYIQLDEHSIPLIGLSEVLNIGVAYSMDTRLTHRLYKIVIIADAEGKYGIVVDDIKGESNLVIRPLDSRLGKVLCVSAASVSEEGDPVMILDMEDIIEVISKHFSQKWTRHRVSKPRRKKQVPNSQDILWVDDSCLARQSGVDFLESIGYTVWQADNAEDAWNVLQKNNIDLLITDLEMPGISGEELIGKVRASPAIEHIPIIVVSAKNMTLEEKTSFKKSRYLNKNGLGNHLLLKTVEDLLKE